MSSMTTQLLNLSRISEKAQLLDAKDSIGIITVQHLFGVFSGCYC